MLKTHSCHSDKVKCLTDLVTVFVTLCCVVDRLDWGHKTAKNMKNALYLKKTKWEGHLPCPFFIMHLAPHPFFFFQSCISFKTFSSEMFLLLLFVIIKLNVGFLNYVKTKTMEALVASLLFKPRPVHALTGILIVIRGDVYHSLMLSWRVTI